jgi:hypothetical protein
MSMQGVEQLTFSHIPHLERRVHACTEQKVAARVPPDTADGSVVGSILLYELIRSADHFLVAYASQAEDNRADEKQLPLQSWR